jgi:hypothetical protein
MFGTGYMQTMRTSFVHYILQHVPTHDRQYMRGPGFDGFDMPSICAAGHEFVRLCKAAKPDSAVLLTGYSRGAAGVVNVALRLKRDRIDVDGMMLFDAVDRTPYPNFVFSGYDIPNNVQRVVHAIRDSHSFSRTSFGHAAARWHAPTVYEPKTFWATHGALGGVPFPTRARETGRSFIHESFPEAVPTLVTHDEDHLGSASIWAWAEPKLRAMGFLGS